MCQSISTCYNYNQPLSNNYCTWSNDMFRSDSDVNRNYEHGRRDIYMESR